MLPEERRDGRVALDSAHCRAVRPPWSSSSVLALARSSACTHASCPWPAASIRAVPPSMSCRSGLAECCSRTEHDGEVAVVRSSHERGDAEAVCRSTLAPRFSSSLTISRWPLAAAACSRVVVVGRPPALVVEQCASTSPSLAQPLDHLLQLTPLCRAMNFDGKRGESVHRLLGFAWSLVDWCLVATALFLPTLRVR